MKVCHFMNGVGPGGAPTLVLNIIKNTKDLDIEYTVAFLGEDDTLVDEFRKVADVVNLDGGVKFGPRALRNTYRFFNKNTFDIIHTHLPYAQTLGRLGSLVNDNAAVVSTQHNFPSQYHPITRTTELMTRPIDDATVGVSNAVVDAFHKLPQPKWKTIYNGIDVSDIKGDMESASSSSIKNRLGIPEDSCLILSVGRYVKEKRQEDIIQAFGNSGLDDAYLVIVGWGPHEQHLRKVANRNNISERTILAGKQIDVWPYYAAADIFVSASKNESFGIVLVEAMAANLPIIATEIPGANEVTEQANEGVVTVPPEDTQALTNSLVEMIEKTPEPDYSGALQKFDISETTSSYISIYRNLS